MQKQITLVYDVSSLIYRVAAVQMNTRFDQVDADDMVGLCMHISLQSFRKWYNKFLPDRVIFAFEGGNNWRKEYTAKNQDAVLLPYKANRVYDPAMKHLYETIDAFYETIKAFTSVACLKVPGLEADDVIGGYCQEYATPENHVYIISGDRDFIQLLKNPNVTLIDPDSGKPRNQPGDKKYEADLDYWLFLKCVRGDLGDYVASAYPRVRETRIKKAYEDPAERVSFMKETWEETLPDGTKKTHVVGNLFEHNKVLVSLFDQPKDIRDNMFAEIEKQLKDTSKYQHFHFIAFCGKFKLMKVADEAAKFAEIFSCNQLTEKNGPKDRSKIKVVEEKEPVKVIEEKITSEASKTDKLKAQLEKIRLAKNKQSGLVGF